MRFESFFWKNDLGGRTETFIPVDPYFDRGNLDPSRPITIQLKGVKRLVLAGLLHNLSIFETSPAQMAQDCSGFAYTCLTGQDLPGREVCIGDAKVGLSHSIIATKEKREAIPAPAHLPAGTVLMTSQALPNDVNFSETITKIHFAVRADADGGDPLYFSKFGTGGSMVVHSWEAGLEQYPARTISIVKSFYDTVA